ncbi:tyrosinase family protein [Aspergillus melleus]|uniref:tyrosinase family protein n=1 Tax=Aspergillus melleus TaxID=138277 RepID=UPI001E8EB0B1|nr:uncharacterized protein LDX57_006981 [Aspergillus melleus]KAH8429314.1 hypothetical protein LDX57_006981 [Aspergillus melleus]
MRLVKLLWLGALGLAGECAAVCTDPPQRKEWRQLDRSERREYLDAVICLTKLPAVPGINGTVNHYDDFQAVHSAQIPEIHWVGHFILWHRYFVAAYEKALREECGYKGAQPYWNWSLDASPSRTSTAIYETEIFDEEYGFGGNGDYLSAPPSKNPFNVTGRTGGGCVHGGAFAPDKFLLNYPQPGCLHRDFIPWVMNSFSRQSLVDIVTSQPDYTSFARAIENIPSFEEPNIHGGAHFGVGGILGTLGDPAESPGDPLFFLHHGNLDRVLWEWQRKELPARYHDVGGPIIPMDYGGVNVTLEFEVNIGKLAPNATLEQLLGIQGDVLCYDY